MAGDEETPYQALYRRFRPQRFSEVRGQEHVTRALRAAVRDGKVAHAYLFSGPRGTGKTSTARILAMALNCEQPEDGEPCGVCASCRSIRSGASLDVVELDSATNRGIDEMRDLLSRVSLGTPGRWKVYIVDEVHQITAAAASALLKTLEEPPGHVIFVLATTDPQKVLDTIRSRTQHFEFRLLGSDVLSSLLADVAKEADIDLPAEAIEVVVRRGHGSARDALSALDQVAAAGAVEDDGRYVAEVVDGLVERDAGQVLVKVAEAASAGLDARRLGTEILEYLRNGFLSTRASGLVQLGPAELSVVRAQADRLGPAGLVRAMDEIGRALIDMRDAADSRTTLEVALVRLAAPELDDGRAALVERIERLERAVSAGTAMPVSSVSSLAPPPVFPPPVSPPPVSPPERRPTPTMAPPRASGQLGAAPPMPGRATTRSAPGPETVTQAAPDPAGPEPAGPPAGAEPAGRPGAGPPSPGDAPVPPARRPVPPPPAPRSVPGPAASSAPPGGGAGSAAPTGSVPSREELTLAWGDRVLPALRPGVKVYVANGRFLPSEGDAAVLALADRGLLARAEPNRAELEGALSQHFGRPVRLKLVLDKQDPASGERPPLTGPSDPEPELEDWAEMAEAPADALTPEQRLLQAFPGAEEV